MVASDGSAQLNQSPFTCAMKQFIIDYHLDELGDWVAELQCGHGQHVRHDPPWQLRPWVLTAEGRAAFLGTQLECVLCEKGAMTSPNVTPPATASAKELLIPRLLMSLISVTLVGLGLMNIVTRHYYGVTNKLGRVEVTLDGPSATAMGVTTVLFGLLPLALWFRTKQRALLWVIACVIAAGSAFYVAIRLQRAERTTQRAGPHSDPAARHITPTVTPLHS